MKTEPSLATTQNRVSWKPGNMLYPVPAVMVSCGREGERPNIITLAWAGTICSDPPMLSVAIRPERYSYSIIEETGEFAVNLVTKDLTYAMDYCGVKSGREMDKFKEMNLTAFYPEDGKVPAILESPVSLVCKVTEIKKLGSHDLFLAEITRVTVDGSYLDEKQKFHLNDAGLVAFSHGEYFELGEKLGSFGYSVKKAGTKVPGKK